MTVNIGVPSPKQRQMMSDTHRYVAYGGARGGGKSWAVRAKAVLLALRWPGIKLIIIRRSYPELANNHISPLRDTLWGIARYNDRDKQYRFDNGSTIAFGYCNADGDLDRYQGAEYDVMFLDEAGQLREEWIRKLTACVRGVNGFPKRVYYTLNPGGPSHGYFKRLFLDKRYEGDERPEDYSFIQSLVTDNAALMASQPDYIRQLQNLPPHIRAMWLEGRWDVLEGQFFEDFRTEPDAAKCHERGINIEQAKRDGIWTHVITAREPPREWKLYRSYDFGYGKPFSCAWWGIDYDGTLYRIMELYGCTDEPNTGVKWSPDQQFEEIARIEREHPWLRGRQIDGVADPACWDASRGESVAETAVRHGVYFTPGDHERIAGWMQLHYRFQFDDNGYARIYVFDCCKAFIRTIPLLMYDAHHPEDLDTSMEDHVADESRYMCMARPVSPQRPVEQRVVFTDPLDQFGGKKWTR